MVDSGDPPALALTGERTLPGIPEENYWFRRHEFAYVAAVQLVHEIGGEARVLDAGCGEGYGAGLLARVASQVVGIDKDSTAVEHARRAYVDPRLLFVTADLEQPETVPEGPFDLIVALHVLDHLDRPDVAVACLAGRLGPGGGLYVATQNQLLLSGAGHASNPFLRSELAPADLVALLQTHFSEVALWGVVHAGELLEAEQEAGGGLPAALVDAAAARVGPPVWATSLVPQVTTDDFAFVDEPGEVAGAYDLVALARTPH
jgi:SAM-dependent methyltransferase